MNGGKAEKLKQKIVSDAEAEARKTVEEGEDQAGRIRKEARAEAARIASEASAKAKAQAEEHIRRQISLRELEARKAILAEKGKLIDEVFDGALRELKERDKKSGYSITRDLLLKAIEVGDEEIILSPEDRQNIDSAFIDNLNASLREAGKRGEVAVSSETRNIDGGFILRRGRAETNSSFGTLLAMLRDDIETEVAGILFGGGGSKA
jgi:V/A-type H+-transporting ATPase subunit E